MLRFHLCLTGVLSLVCSLGAAADTIYHYEDATGKIHFTDTPPDRPTVKEYKLKPVFVMQHSSSSNRASFPSGLHKKEVTPIIDRLAEKHGIQKALVDAIVKAESDYNIWAVSNKGAQGLMQIMPKTGESLGLENPFDPEQNLDAGIRHFKRLMEKYANLDLALAAYNAGEKSVEKYNGIPPFPETIVYVQKIRKYYSQFLNQSTNSSNQGDLPKPVPYL